MKPAKLTSSITYRVVAYVPHRKLSEVATVWNSGASRAATQECSYIAAFPEERPLSNCNGTTYRYVCFSGVLNPANHPDPEAYKRAVLSIARHLTDELELEGVRVTFTPCEAAFLDHRD